jgi:hypothetical protein
MAMMTVSITSALLHVCPPGALSPLLCFAFGSLLSQMSRSSSVISLSLQSLGAWHGYCARNWLLVMTIVTSVLLNPRGHWPRPARSREASHWWLCLISRAWRRSTFHHGWIFLPPCILPILQKKANQCYPYLGGGIDRRRQPSGQARGEQGVEKWRRKDGEAKDVGIHGSESVPIPSHTISSPCLPHRLEAMTYALPHIDDIDLLLLFYSDHAQLLTCPAGLPDPL